MANKKGRVFVAEQEGIVFLKLEGDIRLSLCSSIDDYIESIFQNCTQKITSVIVDVMEANAIDSTSLGILAKLALHAKKEFVVTAEIICSNESIKKLLLSVGFDSLFTITLAEHYEEIGGLNELPIDMNIDEEQFKIKVINAHKILMELNSNNKQAFKELVDNLEQGL